VRKRTEIGRSQRSKYMCSLTRVQKNKNKNKKYENPKELLADSNLIEKHIWHPTFVLEQNISKENGMPTYI